MAEFSRAVVIGYGSIGKKHAQYLINRCEILTIIDPKVKNDPNFANELGAKNVEKFENLESSRLKFEERDVVVIANWGPDHYATLETSILKGALNIILEKPCVDSLFEIDRIKKICRSSPVKIAVNQGWYYLKLGQRINEISTKFDLGEIVAIWITGGARCISTAGSHWLSLANQIYKSNPIQISADGITNNINPRSASLSFYEGVFSFLYSKGRRLGISLTNLSSIEGKFEIYWKNASGILEEEKIEIFTRDLKEIPDRITRYGKPTKKIFSGKINSMNNSSQNQLEVIYDSLENLTILETNANLNQHLDANKSVILSLISSDTKKHINFDADIDPDLYNKKYLIS
jgi:predicted dehydrogenase